MTKENDPIRNTSLYANLNGFKVALEERIKKIIEERISSSVEPIVFGSQKYENLKTFIGNYNRSYTELRRKVGTFELDMGSATTDFTLWKSKWQKELARIGKGIDKVKRDVMLPSFDILGKEAIPASRTAQGMANLIYAKRVSNTQVHQIVSGLVRWQLLDELQQQLRSVDFSTRFALFVDTPGLGGRRVENLYELADKERLRDTLEALYRERYSMSVAQGWSIAKERTQHFLLSFMLSLYHRPLEKLCGKMSAFCRFFSEVCGYGFVATRNLQNWFKAYQDFDWQRKRRDSRPPQNEPQKEYNTWMRRFRKYTAIEEMAAWMRGLYPQYQVTVA